MWSVIILKDLLWCKIKRKCLDPQTKLTESWHYTITHKRNSVRKRMRFITSATTLYYSIESLWNEMQYIDFPCTLFLSVVVVYSICSRVFVTFEYKRNVSISICSRHLMFHHNMSKKDIKFTVWMRIEKKSWNWWLEKR
jgi:hypothetical protein